jgi:hypothetical protein
MKRFTLLALVAFALLVPVIARAEGARFVYKPEFKQWVVVPPPAPVGAAAVTPTPNEIVARHEAMAAAYRGGRMAHAARHCDRMVAQARETLRKQS